MDIWITVRSGTNADIISGALVWCYNRPIKEQDMSRLFPWFCCRTNEKGKVVMVGTPARDVRDEVILRVSAEGYKDEILSLEKSELVKFSRDIYLNEEH